LQAWPEIVIGAAIKKSAKKHTLSPSSVVSDGTAEPGSVVLDAKGAASPVISPKRSRKKKTASSAVSTGETAASSFTGSAEHPSTDAPASSLPAKPKRTRRVGEPKPKRYSKRMMYFRSEA
jgi:hypothetical protein